MLKSRWLSTFTVIGVLLVALGVVGLVLGPRFVYDPGQPVTGYEAWCYLAIGALMILNGVVTPAPAEDKTSPPASGKQAVKTEAKSPAKAAVPADPPTREATVSVADKTNSSRM